MAQWELHQSGDHITLVRVYRYLAQWTSRMAQSDKESTCQCSRQGFDPWIRIIPWRREWQLTPVFLPGKSQGWRSLAGYSSWDCRRVGHDLATKQQPPSTIPGTEYVLSKQAWMERTGRRRGSERGLWSQKSLVLIPLCHFLAV